MYIIFEEKNDFHDDRLYLAWQPPAWDEDGYFWTRLSTVYEMIESSDVLKDKFLFNSTEDAKKFAIEYELGGEWKVEYIKLDGGGTI